MAETPGSLQDPPDDEVDKFEADVADKEAPSAELLEPEIIKTQSDNLRKKATVILKHLPEYDDEVHRRTFDDPHDAIAIKEIRFAHNNMHLGVLIDNGHLTMSGNNKDRNSLTIAMYPSADKDVAATKTATILTPHKDNLRFPGSFSYAEAGQEPIKDSMLSKSRIEEFLDTIADPPPPQGSL